MFGQDAKRQAGATAKIEAAIQSYAAAFNARDVKKLVAHWSPDVFDAFHMLFWQSLIVFFTVLVWVLWAVLCTRSHEPRPA